MKKLNITCHSDLLLHIARLKSQKLSHEIVIKYSIKELVKCLSPASIIKHSVHELSQDKELRFDIAKAGLNISANFLIDKVVGRSKSMKGFLSSMFIENISSVFINKHAPVIISSIRKLINLKQ